MSDIPATTRDLSQVCVGPGCETLCWPGMGFAAINPRDELIRFCSPECIVRWRDNGERKDA